MNITSPPDMSRKASKSLSKTICASTAALLVAVSLSACGTYYAPGGTRTPPIATSASGGGRAHAYTAPTMGGALPAPAGTGRPAIPGGGPNASAGPVYPPISVSNARDNGADSPVTKHRRFKLLSNAMQVSSSDYDEAVPADSSLLVGKWRSAYGDIIEFKPNGEVLKDGKIQFFEVVNSKKVRLFDNYYTKTESKEFAVKRADDVLVFNGVKYTSM